MRTTLAIDDDVLQEAREIAVAEGRSVGSVMSDLARRALRPVGIRADLAFPTFDVEVDAAPIRLADVADALDDG